jgi:hypothetical protein
VQWSRNFSTLISASPTTYGLVEAQATDHQALHDAFIAAFQVAVDPKTRTHTTIGLKNAAKAALIENTRMLVRIIQAAPTTTNDMRDDLNITVPDEDPRPCPCRSTRRNWPSPPSSAGGWS